MRTGGIQRKGRAGSMASRVSRPLEFIPERKCHNSIFQQHKLNLILPKKCFQKVQKSEFLPKSSILSRKPVASGRALEGLNIQVPWPTLAR